jgi:hypothetical protein
MLTVLGGLAEFERHLKGGSGPRLVAFGSEGSPSSLSISKQKLWRGWPKARC